MTETLTETQEERLRENGYFLYQGCHFKPVRQFTEEENFWEVTGHIRRDEELGMMEADYYGKQKRPYSHDEFYAASTDKKADIFFCLETMKNYVPCTHEMQEYDMKPEKQHDRGKAR